MVQQDTQSTTANSAQTILLDEEFNHPQGIDYSEKVNFHFFCQQLMNHIFICAENDAVNEQSINLAKHLIYLVKETQSEIDLGAKTQLSII
jgi:hypothetical protein